MCRPDRDTAVRRKNVTAATRIMPPRAAKKPRSGKGFNWVSAKFGFGCADSRFAEPRSSLWEGFNFVRAKPPLRRAESRFGKPRTSRKGTILFFSLVRKEPKVPQRFANLWTPGDDSNLRSIRSFILNDRRSSCNRRYRKAQPSRVSPVRI